MNRKKDHLVARVFEKWAILGEDVKIIIFHFLNT